MIYDRKMAFYTLGCKLNFAETSTIARSLEEAGYARVSFEEKADVYLINTCSVTENADRKCRQVVRQAKKRNPESKVLVIGCYAQLKPQEIAEIPGVNIVLGASEKFQVQEFIEQIEEQNTAQIFATDVEAANAFHSSYSFGERTRSFLKVQDGCDYSCSFCTIPLARGKSRSAPIDEILKKAREVAQLGIKEVVLTGVNIGDYGQGASNNQQEGENLLDLVNVLDEINGIERFRISSIEPNLLTNEIIEFVAKSQRFMPHFHIPLQSGNNEMLKSMRRRYLRELYVDRVNKIKSEMLHACIGVDVIIGFPGETESHFLDTYTFLNELDVSYLHVFTYSERPNTLAAEMPGEVSLEERRKRSRMLRSLSVKKRRSFYDQFVGTERPVLFEDTNDEGWMFGFTDNYLKIKCPFKNELANQILPVNLKTISADGKMQISMPELMNA